MNASLRPHETSSQVLLRLSLTAALGVGMLALLLLATSALLAFLAFGMDFLLWATVLILGGGALLVAAILVRGWENARWMLVETIAAQVEKSRAEAHRIEAEADAISGGSSVINQQIHTTATGKAKVAINAPVMQENIRLVPVSAPGGKLIEGLPAPAICFFIDQYDVRGWSQRAWVDCGMRIPGLSEPVGYDTWRQLVGVIEKVGGCPPVRERTKIKPLLDLQVIKAKALGPGFAPPAASDETA